MGTRDNEELMRQERRAKMQQRSLQDYEEKLKREEMRMSKLDQDRVSLRSLKIEDGETEIEPYKYYGYQKLEKVAIPGSVEEIGEGAFMGCSALSVIRIEEGVKKIGEKAFAVGVIQMKEGGKITTVPLHGTPTEGSASLKSVDIPASVEEIGKGAFEGADCTVHIKDGNKTYSVPGEIFNHASLAKVKEKCREGAQYTDFLGALSAKKKTTRNF